MDKKRLLKRFKQFCKQLSQKDTIAILHHSDADGFCSALITAKAIEKLSGKKPVVVQAYEYGNKRQLRKAVALMQKEKANTLIVLDLAIDSEQDSIIDVYPFEKCLVIDHHKMCKDLNSEKIFFFKAEFFTKKDSSAYVTSKFAFDLFNRVTDVRELDWLACIGILGDMNLKNWRPFVKKTIQKRNVSLAWLYEFILLIASVEVLALDKMAKLFWLFYNAEKPDSVLQSRFQKYVQKFKHEKDSLVEGFEKKAEHLPEIELYFYAIKVRHENIKSYVINEISEMHPNETIILLHYLGGGRLRLSARRQDCGVRVNDLLAEAVKDIPQSTAGGHTPAAGGSIARKYASKFKKNVVEILRKKYRE